MQLSISQNTPHWNWNLHICVPKKVMYCGIWDRRIADQTLYIDHGSLTRYVNLWVAHAPGMPGTFSPPPTSKDTASYRSQHASRHVRDARAVMHVGIANPVGARKAFPAFPAHAQHATLRIWQEAHDLCQSFKWPRQPLNSFGENYRQSWCPNFLDDNQKSPKYKHVLFLFSLYHR